MLSLPGITLVIAETRAHDLARRTITNLISRVEFGGILVYSNDCTRIAIPGATCITVPDWPDKVKSGSFYYTEAAKPVTTSHALLMEWDAGLNYPEEWTDDFLNYDFIGAPWPGRGHSRVRDGMNVGNGGFMLLSKRLIDHLYDNRHRRVIATDYNLACDHRRAIESEGSFKWAPDDIAAKFSHEGWDMGMPVLTARPRSFGYHGLHNWHVILEHNEMIERSCMVAQNDFTRRTKLPLLIKSAPWITTEIPFVRTTPQYAIVRQGQRILPITRHGPIKQGLKA